jgi:ComF family protein
MYRADNENPVAQLFWGRVKIEGATSMLLFEKGSRYQGLLHQLKYKGRKEIGIYLGKMLGVALKGTLFAQADFILPVPLHKKRLRERGYNQSLLIARGVSMILEIPVMDHLLIRHRATDSQTRRNRFERWLNMDTVFSLDHSANEYSRSSFLLIDDVITTGSTLESCCRAIMELDDVKIFVATVARA